MRSPRLGCHPGRGAGHGEPMIEFATAALAVLAVSCLTMLGLELLARHEIRNHWRGYERRSTEADN